MKFLVVASCAFLVSGPALAQNVGSVSGSAAELSGSAASQEHGDESARGADGERRICRRVETSSASRMSTRRICRTAQEWREAQRGG